MSGMNNASRNEIFGDLQSKKFLTAIFTQYYREVTLSYSGAFAVLRPTSLIFLLFSGYKITS